MATFIVGSLWVPPNAPDVHTADEKTKQRAHHSHRPIRRVPRHRRVRRPILEIQQATDMGLHRTRRLPDRRLSPRLSAPLTPNHPHQSSVPVPVTRQHHHRREPQRPVLEGPQTNHPRHRAPREPKAHLQRVQELAR